MSLLSTFHWLEATGIGTYGRRSSYFFPAIEVIHLLGLTLLLGSVLVINLRLLGATMRRQPIADVARATSRLLWLGATLSVASGLFLFLTEAVKCYYNVAFWYKMGFLLSAVVFQLGMHWWLNGAPSTSRRLVKCIAALSLTLWFGVAVAGRAIAFI
jgi:hypothetical protein